MAKAKLKLEYRLRYENWFFRTVMRDLSGSEVRAMLYIIDRTLGWQRHYAVINYREFEDGCDGHRGVGLKKTAAYRAVKSLEELGLIVMKSKNYGSTVYLQDDFEYVEDLLQIRRELKADLASI